MWRCQKCGEDVDNIFDRCWNCGTLKDGSAPDEPEHVPQSSPTSQEDYGRLFDTLYQEAIKLLRQDVPGEQVVETLHNAGLKHEDARMLVEEFLQNIRDGKKVMLQGAILCLTGIIMSVLSYLFAVSGGGGMYVISSGAILGGVGYFMKGLLQWARVSSPDS